MSIIEERRSSVTEKDCARLTSRRTATASTAIHATPSSLRVRSAGFSARDARAPSIWRPTVSFTGRRATAADHRFSRPSWKDRRQATSVKPRGRLDLATKDRGGRHERDLRPCRPARSTMFHRRPYARGRASSQCAARCRKSGLVRVQAYPVHPVARAADRLATWLTLGDVVACPSHIDLDPGRLRLSYRAASPTHRSRPAAQGDYFEIREERDVRYDAAGLRLAAAPGSCGARTGVKA